MAAQLNLGSMVFCVQISSIWSEILVHAFRSQHRSTDQYIGDLESFCNSTVNKLSSWIGSLPAQWINSISNAKVRISMDDAGAFVSIHAIYFSATIKLKQTFAALI